jgi:peptide/nickel transport system permease protein
MTARLVLRKLAVLAFTVWCVLTIMFFMFKLLPGDPTAIFLDNNFSSDVIKQQKQLWGLTDPLWVQYARYLWNMARFQFGNSFFSNDPVATILAKKVLNTCLMIVPALIISIIGGTLIGALAGWRRNSLFEKVAVAASLLFHSAPSFVVGIFALMVFSYELGWLPSGGIVSIGAPDTFWRMLSSGDYLKHLILPCMVLVSREITGPILLLRNSMLEVKGSDFIDILRAKGLRGGGVVVHATRNAMLPLITYIAVMTATAFQGQVLLEIIFSWPGIGREMVSSLRDLDYPIAQAALYLMALITLSMNFLADLAYSFIDPRVASE